MFEWQQSGLKLCVSVNVSASQLQHPNFLAKLKHALNSYPSINPNNLELEILESSALVDLEHTRKLLHKAEKLGVVFALDDFGTGYSSLSYLKNLPIQTIKIDQSFVRNMLDQPSDLNIIEGIIGLAKSFHRKVIAEGMETPEQGTILLHRGCTNAQGYGIARPMPAQSIPAWITAFSPPAAWCHDAQSITDLLPLLRAEAEHKHWVQLIESYALNPSDEQHLEHNAMHCAFGQWLSGSAQEHYGHDHRFPMIVQLHARIHELARFHQLVGDAVESANRKDCHCANSKMLEVELLSSEVVSILEELETMIEREGHQHHNHHH